MIYHLNAITVENYISISNDAAPRIELHKTVKYEQNLIISLPFEEVPFIV